MKRYTVETHNTRERLHTRDTMPTSARYQDDNGYLLVKGCPVASFGIFQYSAEQLGLEGDPSRIVNVFRPESEVSNPEYLDSFQVVPLINDHEMLSGFQNDDTATAPEEKGVDGALFGVTYAKPWVKGDLKIFSRSMQADLSAGKKDLSLGYTCDFDMTPGEYNGQPYEVVQINMRGNHIALVDIGRVPGARVLDGKKRLCFDHLDVSFTQPKGDGMKRRKAMDSNAVQTLKTLMAQLLPAFEQFMNEEATEPAHQGAEAGAEGGAAASAVDPAAAGGETGTGELAAQAAADPNVDPNANANPQVSAEGEGDGGDDTEQLMSLMQQMLPLLQQLAGGSAEGAEQGAAAEGGEGSQASGESGEGSGAASGEEGQGDEGEMGGAEGSGEAAAGEGQGGEGQANDTVEGLQCDAGEGGPALGEGGQGQASQGPAAGKHTGADASLRRFHADLAYKGRVVDRLSKVVGAFDGAMDIASATADDVVAYGVKRLKIKCAKGTERVALDAALAGFEAARKVTTQAVQQKAMDAAAAAEVPAIDAYFQAQE